MSSPASPGVAAIRTLALVGPASSGKTSLAEALLVKAGAIGAAGSLERGTTVSDYDPLERRMQHSLSASVMHLSASTSSTPPARATSSATACRRSRRWRRRPWSSTPPPASSRWPNA
jgi:ABC-type glutathione transport system ATPase component